MTKRLLSVLLVCAACCDPALATEGALGRPITGLQGMSYSGLVPPTPGWNMQLAYVYYSGGIGASREVPIAGTTSLGLDVSVDMFSVTGSYIWDTGEGRWNYASMLTLPYISVDATSTLALGPVDSATTDSDQGPYDVFFAPVIASRHFSPLQHLSLSLYVYAPTGAYDVGRLANPGLNVWTYSPTVGYTQLFQQGTLEWSSTAAFDIYGSNDDTDYQNGIVFRLDSVLVKRFANGWGIGAAGGWIEQIEDDEGAIADRLDGFRGHSLSLGPMATYLNKWDGGQVEFSARWLTEFNVKNRFEGNPLMLLASIQF